jgi:hypothetical protein
MTLNPRSSRPFQFPVAKPGYRPQATDTCVETDLLQFYLLRQKTSAERWQAAAAMIRWARTVALRAIQRASPEQVALRFSEVIFKEYWTPNLIPHSDSAMWAQDPIAIAQLLHPVFEQLNLRYYITGDVAAIAHGESRTTQDLDLVIEVDVGEVNALVNALEAAGFYVPAGAVEDVKAGRGRLLSVTHIEQVLKADIVLNGDTRFDRARMDRRQLISLDLAGESCYWVGSPKDIILAKLSWGQRSDSEKQWRDVLGVLKVQQPVLDYGDLAGWAAQLGLSERLERAMVEAGI